MLLLLVDKAFGPKHKNAVDFTGELLPWVFWVCCCHLGLFRDFKAGENQKMAADAQEVGLGAAVDAGGSSLSGVFLGMLVSS